jgi:hypothetical protein
MLKNVLLVFLERDADRGTSANEGNSVIPEGYKVIMHDQVMECAQYECRDVIQAKENARLCKKNSGFGYSTGNECDVATHMILKNQGKGKSMELVAENRSVKKVHSLGICEQQDWKSNNLVFSQNVNDKRIINK